MTLASACVGAARLQPANSVVTLRGTQGAAFVIGAHVPGEVLPAIKRITRRNDALNETAVWIWKELVAPHVAVVDLPISEYLRPEIQVVARGVGRAGARHRGDADDLPTAAVAAFLAPTIIWSRDHVFTQTGLAATDPTSTGRDLVTLAVSKSVADDATSTAGVLASAGVAIAEAAHRGAIRSPQAAILIAAGAAAAGVYASPRLWSALPSGLRAIARRARQLVSLFGGLYAYQECAAAALVKYESPPWRDRVALELCAIALTQAQRPMTASELFMIVKADLHSQPAHTISSLKRDLAAHPAFTSVRPNSWRLGTPADLAGR
jgi:hypothetical protein